MGSRMLNKFIQLKIHIDLRLFCGLIVTNFINKMEHPLLYTLNRRRKLQLTPGFVVFVSSKTETNTFLQLTTRFCLNFLHLTQIIV
jgi:hypothetical protein